MNIREGKGKKNEWHFIIGRSVFCLFLKGNTDLRHRDIGPVKQFFSSKLQLFSYPLV